MFLKNQHDIGDVGGCSLVGSSIATRSVVPPLDRRTKSSMSTCAYWAWKIIENISSGARNVLTNTQMYIVVWVGLVKGRRPDTTKGLSVRLSCLTPGSVICALQAPLGPFTPRLLHQSPHLRTNLSAPKGLVIEWNKVPQHNINILSWTSDYWLKVVFSSPSRSTHCMSGADKAS